MLHTSSQAASTGHNGLFLFKVEWPISAKFRELNENPLKTCLLACHQFTQFDMHDSTPPMQSNLDLISLYSVRVETLHQSLPSVPTPDFSSPKSEGIF